MLLHCQYKIFTRWNSKNLLSIQIWEVLCRIYVEWVSSDLHKYVIFIPNLDKCTNLNIYVWLLQIKEECVSQRKYMNVFKKKNIFSVERVILNVCY